MTYQLKGEQITAAEAISTFLTDPTQSRFLSKVAPAPARPTPRRA